MGGAAKCVTFRLMRTEETGNTFADRLAALEGGVDRREEVQRIFLTSDSDLRLMVLNTSFNENEPVVCRPEEALDCFLRTKMDVLVLGGIFIMRST